MDDFANSAGVIDPEVRAHVYSLVTALGGASASEDGRYVLGDDALACLKDIKRWLKLHDDKLSRLDVTRCLAEAHLVKGDILEILGQWPEEAMNEKWRGRMALACVELLVPLTWPIEKDLMSEVTRNQHRHLPYVKVAQITYKREILEHPSGDLLRKILRLALPAMAVPGHERSLRDEGVIKLVAYFIRNIVMISASANLPVEWNEQEVSRSSTIRVFDQQSVLTMLLSMASNISTDFKTQDVIILEILFHLLKGVDPKRLFMTKPQRSVAASSELRHLMSKETDLLKTFAKHAPTRHNRFGTMIWIERSEAKMSMVSGQDVLRNGPAALEKMDKSKRWNKPKRRPKDDKSYMSFDLPESLTEDANERLRAFVENFLDSGFNPLFAHLRKAIEREADRVLIAHSQQFWYLVAWFLRAESERRKAKKEKDKKKTTDDAYADVDSFGVVASVLNQETFILLNRYMQAHLDNKEWNELDAGMRCFTQILLTVQEMANSPLDEDQEIADNIQNNIFYEETTHDRILAILRGYKDQNFSYLDAVTELSHVFLRLLERYSKENGDLQIRSRRRARVKKAKVDTHHGRKAVNARDDDGNASEADDEEQAAKISRERKFDFNRFASKFITQNSINTFVKFIGFYHDLNAEQLKRAHRFFYRVAFKQEMTVLLFRLDIIHLFSRIIKNSGALRRSDPTFAEWAELVKQIFRRLVKKMEQRPELAVELLFSKIPSTCHYLEYGYEKQTVSAPRAPAELEVRGGLSHADQIGVAVAALFAEGKDEAVDWVSRTLRSAAGERRSWEDLDATRAVERTQDRHIADQAGTNSIDDNLERAIVTPFRRPVEEPPSIPIMPESNALKLALFTDNKLRLLLRLVSAERHGSKDDPSAVWVFPTSLTSVKLFNLLSVVEQHIANPQQTYGELEDNPVTAAEMLKRVTSTKPVQTNTLFDSDNEGDFEDFLNDDGNMLMPAGGPTARNSDILEQLKAKRQQNRGLATEVDEVDIEIFEQRRLARHQLELEKRRRIKSTEFIHESDDESDEERDREFFAREKEVAVNRTRKHDRVFEAEKQRFVAGSSKRKHTATECSNSGIKRLRGSDNELSSGELDDAGHLETSGRDVTGLAESSAENSDEESLFVGDRGTRRRISLGYEHVAAGNTEDEQQTPISSQSEPRVERLALMETKSTNIIVDSMNYPATGGMSQQESIVRQEVNESTMPTKRTRARIAILDDSDDE